MTTPESDAEFRVDQLDHVELFVPDRREAALWYERVLGLRAVPHAEHWAQDPNGPLMISSDSGNTMLALFIGEPQGLEPTSGFHRVAFRVRAVAFAEFAKRLSAAGLLDERGDPVTPERIVDHDAAWSIYFCDPFGHRLEVTTYDYDEARSLMNSTKD